MFALFVGLYGATRFGLELFRHFDQEPTHVFGYSAFTGLDGVTNNQLISLAMVVASLLLGIWLRRRFSGTS
jgi:prolipoprotein diacylglyceryltransferase